MASLDLRALALAQRFAIWGEAAGFVGLLNWYVFLAATPLMLHCAWRITKTGAFGVPATILWPVLMLIPVVNVLALISLSHRPTLKLRTAGVRGGLFRVSWSNLPPATKDGKTS